MTPEPSIDRVTVTEASGLDDVALVQRARAGDVEAFGVLVERHRRAVFRAALDNIVAEDTTRAELEAGEKLHAVYARHGVL